MSMIPDVHQYINLFNGTAMQCLPQVPLAPLTTYGVGGTADLLVRPTTPEQVALVVQVSQEHDIPLFVLGGGANILVSDKGIRGIVMDMGGLAHFGIAGSTLECGAGLAITSAAQRAAELGYAGLHFLYSMPGSVGGALWMNARCYGHSIDQVFLGADIVDSDGKVRHYTPTPAEYGYKKSPFQTNNAIIVSARFQLTARPPRQVEQEMQQYRADRASKGHFSAPSAGSVFKNNRRFGAPSGVIIDSLGLRGHQIGGARISEAHANIIINTGTATANDIRTLIEYTANRVEQHTGHTLVPEVLYIGEWDSQQ